jgi:hypothetical protein
MAQPLRRYWFRFRFDPEEDPPPAAPGTITLDGQSKRKRHLGLGVGVTGFSQEDCLALIQERLIPQETMPPIASVEVDVDVSAIDDFYWRHNLIGVPSERGIWSPPENLHSTATWLPRRT